MLLRDALLAYLHFALIFLLSGLLFAELAIYRQTMARSVLTTLQRIDLAYGIVAGVVVFSGVARMLWGLKGAGYYLHNPLFWTKISIFLVVALLSIPPTLHYIRIAKTPGDTIALSGATYDGMRALILAEGLLLLLIPFFAVMMARFQP